MTISSIRSRRGNILVVDDSLDNLRVLSASLTSEGYEVRCVKSGAMALVGVKAAPPDLILLDIRMPGMDGYEVCQQLKANPETHEIPVIFLSALDEVLDKVKAFRVGGADYITKPFQLEEVVARIEHQLTIRHLQQQLVQQNELLQQEIIEHERTEASLRNEIYYRSMAEAALQDAKEAAEAANYAKSEFLSKMSHELRTPLNAILGFTQTMRTEGGLSTTQQEFLTIIGRNGEHLLDLINAILEMTKIDAGKVALTINISDLYRLFDVLQDYLRPQARSKGLQLQFEIAATVPLYARLDERKLRSVLMNLIGNAIQFTEQGSVTVRVNAERLETWEAIAPQSATPTLTPYKLLFEVEDTGLGIAPDELGMLFEVFSQTETGRQSERGIGLGLTISRHFIQLMGGDIEMTSAVNQGTVVRFSIPVYSSESIDSLVLGQPSRLTEATIPAKPEITSELNALNGSVLAQLHTVMSEEWLTQLHYAAVKGQDYLIFQLLDAIPSSQTLLGKQLMDWAANYQFDKIIELTEQALFPSA